jgi:DeoR family glycerol-3-phosphate regulon repressor
VKPRDRQSAILDVIARAGEATVEALAAEFRVSAETIRRDLAHLAETGALQKVHGGARRPRLLAEGSFAERMAEDAAAKAAIAQKLRDLVAPGDTLFIDTGTTTLAAAEALTTVGRLTVITNSARIAQVMGRTARVFLLGGSFAPDNAETVGPTAIAQIGQFQADHAVIGVAAVDAGAGAMDADPDEAQVARAMCANAARVVVLAHAAKLGRKAAFRICRLEEMDVLVSDGVPGDAFRAALDAARVELR